MISLLGISLTRTGRYRLCIRRPARTSRLSDSLSKFTNAHDVPTEVNSGASGAPGTNRTCRIFELTPFAHSSLTLNETPENTLGSSREAILVLLAVLVASMFFQRRSLGRRLEILEADFALYALRSDVLCLCVS